MKSFIRWTLALAAGAVMMPGASLASMRSYGLAGSGFLQGAVTQHSVLTIKADGSSSFTSQTDESRTSAEQQARAMERWQQRSAEQDEESPEAELSSTNATTEPKPFTDEELIKKLTEMMDRQMENSGAEGSQKFTVEMHQDIVSIITTRSFASLDEMLKDGYAIWYQGGVAFENARFETDTNGQLRVTLTPQRNMEHYLKNLNAQWKLSGAKLDFTLIFPGPVITSGLPAMQTNATWLVVDGKEDATLSQLAKLYTAPTVITAESAGFKLSQPMESKKLQRSRRQPGVATDDLPLTEAGPGFVAEAQSLTTTTLHVFADGKDYFENNHASFGSQTGTVVNVKLFAPKGRTLKSVSNLRVLTAVDDKGRSVVAQNEDDESSETEIYSGGSQDASAMQVQIRLQLPAPDAQSLDEVAVEAEAITIGLWKEMTLTNLQENATNQVDLATLLPGAKLTITKFSNKNNQIKIQVRLQGPRAVRGLEIQAKIPGNDGFSSNSFDQNSATKGSEFTRTVTIQGYSFGNEEASSPTSLVLLIRQPEDQRRERIKFELKGLDLL